jgi:hypothetical protein
MFLFELAAKGRNVKSATLTTGGWYVGIERGAMAATMAPTRSSTLKLNDSSH